MRLDTSGSETPLCKIDKKCALGYNTPSTVPFKEEALKDPKQDPRRMLRGLRVHRDVDWNYSFWRPRTWHRFDMDDQYGFIYSPGADSRIPAFTSERRILDRKCGGIS